jgi:hypothetical protein
LLVFIIKPILFSPIFGDILSYVACLYFYFLLFALGVVWMFCIFHIFFASHDCKTHENPHYSNCSFNWQPWRQNAEVNLYDGSDWLTVNTRQAVADSTNQIGGFLFNLSAVYPQ